MQVSLQFSANTNGKSRYNYFFIYYPLPNQLVRYHEHYFKFYRFVGASSQVILRTETGFLHEIHVGIIL